MSITEKASSTQHTDENYKKLVAVAKGLEETLLDYANYKPSKKIHTNTGEGKTKANDEADKTNKFRHLIEKIFEFNQIYKRQREQKLQTKKKPSNKIKIKLEDNYPESSLAQSEEEEESENNQEKMEQYVMNMLEDGERHIFKIINSRRLLRDPNSNAQIKTAVETLTKIFPSKSPGKPASSKSHSRPQTPTDRNRYDIQGFYKKITDMMMDEEDPGSPKIEMKRKPSTNPSTPHNLFNPLFPKKNGDAEDQEGKANMFPPFAKRDLTIQIDNTGKRSHLMLNKLDSPSVQRDALVLSPLFSTTHHQFLNNSFFRGFTPTHYTPRVLDTARGNEEFMFRPSPTELVSGGELNAQMDKIVDNLKAEIQHNSIQSGSEPNSGQKGMNLDIDLINDTYAPAPPTKSSVGFKFPPQTLSNRSLGSSFRRMGDLLQSPNSSFLPRKKL